MVDKKPPITLLGVVERLITAAAIVGGTIYVLVNALYIEFYDDFGVRPEEIGLDRLAVLGRVAWVALVGIALAGLVSWLALLVPGGSPRISLPGRLGRGRLLGGAALAATVTLLLGYWVMQNKVEAEADRVRQGESINGLSLIVPFIDLPVTRAEVTWLGDPERRPAGLDSPHLMYLGRGPDVAVFVDCGRATLIVPADEVSVQVRRDTHPPDKRRAEQRRELDDAC